MMDVIVALYAAWVIFDFSLVFKRDNVDLRRSWVSSFEVVFFVVFLFEAVIKIIFLMPKVYFTTATHM